VARILLTCWGSHGDIDPFLGLGAVLRDRGHVVTIATIEYYRDLVTSTGLQFRVIRPDVNPTQIDIVARALDPRTGSEFLLKELLFPGIGAMFDDINAAAEGADLLVSHPITFATPIVAQHRGIPWASVVLAPTSFFSTYDYPVLPPAPWLKSLERLGHWPGRMIVGLVRRATAPWCEPAQALRERLHLPRGEHPLFEGQHSPDLVLALYSRVLGDPQPDWPPHAVVTGAAFYDAPHGTSLPPALEVFLDEGPPPVVFTLGSSVVLVAGDFWRESIDAARRIGARAVLLTGPGNAAAIQPTLGRDMIAVDRAPHSQLFPRASVVVQQCGVGTIAQSLRSGRPMLAVPYAHDQPDNAWRARRLGMARILRPRQYRGPRVARELELLTTDPRYAAAAARVATVVRTEGGAQAACDAIERMRALS